MTIIEERSPQLYSTLPQLGQRPIFGCPATANLEPQRAALILVLDIGKIIIKRGEIKNTSSLKKIIIIMFRALLCVFTFAVFIKRNIRL